MKYSILIISGVLMFAGCQKPVKEPAPAANEPEKPLRTWAIAIHGGAGTISRDIPVTVQQNYENALRTALQTGVDALKEGANALDVVEKVIRILEDDPHFNAGKGAVFTATGEHELDASIMDGKTLACGAVAGVKTVKNPISLARLVMEKTDHVLLAGAGAEDFADQMRVERVKNSWFSMEHRKNQLKKAQERQAESGSAGLLSKASRADLRGTVGCVVLDTQGNLAAGTSTGGMTNKRFGRIGDSPIVGAGNYASNKTVAVSCTGTGEEFIRFGVARDVSAIMEYQGKKVNEAARDVIFGKLQPDDGGLIAVSKTGEIAMVFNSTGMYRGAAGSDGYFEIKIWE